jgi:formyl-CoA transferase
VRGARQEELDGLIGEWTKTLTIAELEARMIEAGCPLAAFTMPRT